MIAYDFSASDSATGVAESGSGRHRSDQVRGGPSLGRFPPSSRLSPRGREPISRRRSPGGVAGSRATPAILEDFVSGRESSPEKLPAACARLRWPAGRLRSFAVRPFRTAPPPSSSTPSPIISPLPRRLPVPKPRIRLLARPSLPVRTIHSRVLSFKTAADSSLRPALVATRPLGEDSRGRQGPGRRGGENRSHNAVSSASTPTGSRMPPRRSTEISWPWLSEPEPSRAPPRPSESPGPRLRSPQASSLRADRIRRARRLAGARA